MKYELKSCPFCGNENVVLENKNGGYQVRCRFCGARGKYTVVGLRGSRMEAINAWNRRGGKTMKKVIILTEDDYNELRKAILDAMYDYQHTRGGICERLQKAINILDGEDGEKNVDA